MSISDFAGRVADALRIELPRGPDPKAWQYLDAIFLRGDIQKTMDAQRERMRLAEGGVPTPAPAEKPEPYRRPPATSEYGFDDFARGGAAAPPIFEPTVFVRRPASSAPAPPWGASSAGPGLPPSALSAGFDGLTPPTAPRNPISLPQRPWWPRGQA